MDSWILGVVLGGLLSVISSTVSLLVKWCLDRQSEREKQRRQWLKEYRDENMRPVQDFLDWAGDINYRYGSGMHAQILKTMIETELSNERLADALESARKKPLRELLDEKRPSIETALVRLGDNQLKQLVGHVIERLAGNLSDDNRISTILDTREVPAFEEVLSASYIRIRGLLTEDIRK